MPIAENIKKLSSSIPENVKLVAVSKTKPIVDILQVYNTGYKIFGENKVQDLTNKYEELPKDIEWHFIGHLQTNKAKDAVSLFEYIHSVDSLHLLNKIIQEAEKLEKNINILLELNLSGEEQKYGFSLEEFEELLKDIPSSQYLSYSGIMVMGKFIENKNDLLEDEDIFMKAKEISERYKGIIGKDISMGMSQDYEAALKNGSTMIRVGSYIFS